MRTRTTAKPPPAARTSQPGSSPSLVTAARSEPLGPTDEQIRRRAYEIFLARNGGPGDALTDWVQAERELASRAGAKKQ